MIKRSIIKSSSGLDNKELFPVSGSSYQKVWISSDSDTEEEDNIDTDDPDSIDSDMLESLSLSVCKLWHKRQLQINADFSVTGWILCVIPHIRKDAKDHSDSDHRKQVNNVIDALFSGLSEEEMDVTLDFFGLSTLHSITRLVHMMLMNLYGKAKTLVMATVICGIKNIHFLSPRFRVWLHV